MRKNRSWFRQNLLFANQLSAFCLKSNVTPVSYCATCWAGGGAEPGGAQAGGEGAAAPDQPGHRGKGADAEAAGHGDAQAEGHRVGAECSGSEAPSGEISFTDQGRT